MATEGAVDPRVAMHATPAAFSRAHFAWSAYPYQEEVMDAVLLQGANRVAWVAGRRVGKTMTIANIALQLAVRKPGTEIAIFAPTARQAYALSRRIKERLRGSAFQRNVAVDNVSELRLRFGSDAHGKPVESVIFANSMSGKVRGQGADVLIVDESAFCKGDDYRNKALPFVADRPDAIIIHISTIWADDDHFSEALRVYPTLPRGRTFRTPTRMKPGVTEEYLKEARAAMAEADFLREFECALVPDGGVFDRRALAACLRDYELLDLRRLADLRPKRHHAYYVGVDWAKKQDRAVIAVVEQGSLEKERPARLVFLQAYDPDPENPHHYSRIVDDVLKVAKQIEATKVTADEGEGGHQAEVLRRALGGRFEPFRFTGRSRNWLVESALFLVEKRGLELPMEPDEVRRAFTNVHRTEEGFGHTSRRGKDVFDAIALALLPVGKSGVGEERDPPRLLSASPGSDGVGLRGPEAPRLPDMLRVVFGDEAVRWLREARTS